MAIFNHVTLREIGAELGVSHVTVSLALKDSPRISKGRRLEVRKMASKMGYRPDPVLTSLCAYRNRKRSVKIKIHSALAWVNHWDQPDALRRIGEFDAYWVGASAEAERFGYHLEEFVWTRALTAERFQTILHTRNLRGVLIPPHPSEPDWGNFNWENFSVIRFGLSVRNPESHVITADHLRGIIAAIQKIHDYGYKRIGFVVPGDLDLRLGGGWTGGFVAAQKLLKLPNTLPPLITDQYSGTLSYVDEFKQWWERYKPDAILTPDSRLVTTLAHLKLRIPQDVAVAATTLVDIPVDTGINQNSEEIGRVAVETLISLINSNDRGKPTIPRRILVQGSWVDGTSLPNRNVK